LPQNSSSPFAEDEQEQRRAFDGNFPSLDRKGDTASVKSTRDVINNTVASYDPRALLFSRYFPPAVATGASFFSLPYLFGHSFEINFSPVTAYNFKFPEE